MAGQQDWEIKSRADHCSVSEQKFADGETFYSALIFEAEGYVRNDYGEKAWAAIDKSKAFSVWKSVFRLPPPPSEETLKKENAEGLLRKFMEDEDQSNINAIFILAVLLERKRILVERDVQKRDDGMKIRVYEHKQTGEHFLISGSGVEISSARKGTGRSGQPDGGAPGTSRGSLSRTAGTCSRIVLLIRKNSAHPASRIWMVSVAPGYDMNMSVENRLAR